MYNQFSMIEYKHWEKSFELSVEQQLNVIGILMFK